MQQTSAYVLVYTQRSRVYIMDLCTLHVLHTTCTYMYMYSTSFTDSTLGRMGRQTFVWSNGLVLSALDSQSMGPGSMPQIDICLSILSFSPSPEEFNLNTSTDSHQRVKFMNTAGAEKKGTCTYTDVHTHY